ncbi:zinc finger CCCH domain-containing protein 62-like [Cynara cardunculus var. scolymus]|nr:zinc finger CCCH domain-containing protein 62-like [Cynara cardunculus var. scolymus]
MVEKLKVEQCKLYLRKHGLRLTGKKDILIHRIKEHISIMNGEGEHKYPACSFVMNCKGDSCTGDVVLFEQNVYEMFSIASRSATGPPCGTRVIAGRIVKESYGAAKQQHTFTIEVLWSKGVKPLPPLHPLLIKGRNLYRLKTMRQRWENESERQKILSEKHFRGNTARSYRAARLQEKEIKKALRERTSKGNIQNENQAKKTTASPTRPMIKAKNPTKPDFQNASIQHETRNWPPPSDTHPHAGVPYTEVLRHQPLMSRIHYPHEGSYKENINSNMLRSAVGWEPNTSSRNTFQAEQNCRLYPSRPFQNLPQTHAFQQGHLPREVQNLPQSHSSQQGYLPREVQNLPQSHTSQQGHLPRDHHHQGQRQQLCRYYPQGRCHYGTNCKYLH